MGMWLSTLLALSILPVGGISPQRALVLAPGGNVISAGIHTVHNLSGAWSVVIPDLGAPAVTVDPATGNIYAAGRDLFVITPSGWLQDSVDLPVRAFTVALQDSLLAVGTDYGFSASYLLIYALRGNTLQPRGQLSYGAGTSDIIYDVKIRFPYLLALFGDADLRVYDITDPSTPVLETTLTTLSSFGEDMELRNDTLWVLTTQDLYGFRIVLPDTFALFAQYTHNLTGANEFHLVDTLIAIASRSRVDLLSIADPSSPTLIANIPVQKKADDVFFLSPSELAIADSGCCITFVDLSDPANPQVTSRVFTGGLFEDFVMDTDTSGFLAMEGEGWSRFEGTSPRLDTVISIPSVEGLALDGNRLALFSPDSGVRLVDASTYTPWGFWDPSGFGCMDGVFLGTWLYAACPSDAANIGIVVLDVQDSSAPAPVDTLIHDWGISEIGDVQGNLLVAVSRWGNYVYPEEVVLVDVSSPQSPQVLSTMEVPGFAYTARIRDTFLVAGGDGVVLFGIADPSQPVSLDTVGVRGKIIHGLAWWGDTLFAGTDSGWLYGLQVAGNQLVKIDSLDFRLPIFALEIAGNRMVVSSYREALTAWEIQGVPVQEHPVIHPDFRTVRVVRATELPDLLREGELFRPDGRRVYSGSQGIRGMVLLRHGGKTTRVMVIP